MTMFQEIQGKWKKGVFNKDWSVYVAEKSASISVMACYNVQRSYNREVSSHSLSKEVEPGKDGQKAEVIFEDGSNKDQKAEIVSEDELKDLEKDDQKDFEEGSEGSEKDDNPFIAMDWHVWLERILEFSIEEARVKILTYKYTPANGFEEIMIKYIGKVLMDL
ncbi:hypothetical protein C1646_760867 [Rhizophagus diaphanus]|nr:hypothetical protein C1646_760867 [Rhizophagus diaphanus] [Rhizophagus sp. MUCL 43196]